MRAQEALKITVIGTGYVGLTTGLALAYLGHKVSCVDNDPEIVEKLKKGQPSFHEPGAAELLKETVPRMRFTENLADAAGADVYIIAVGTPSKENGDADLSFVEETARQIGELLGEGEKTVVVNKSTVPIGTARRVEAVIKNTLRKKGVAADVVVASNPEFLREGAALSDTFYPERIVVGAEDVRAFNLLRQMYAPILEQTFVPPKTVPRPKDYVLPVYVTTSPASAELIKYANNAFLAMKISFINEFAGLAEKVGANIKEVARGIGLDKRIGPHFLAAGAGWGGSCLPKDTRAILYTGAQYDYRMPLVEAACEVNRRQRRLMVEKLLAALKVVRGRTIGVLGLSFKPNTDDLRDSPALEIMEMLLELGALVKAYDPVSMENCRRNFPNLEVEYADSALELAEGCDALALVTDWEEFAYLPWEEVGRRMRQKIIVDGRNMLPAEELRRLGFVYIGMGV